jgi:hypothetical protein
MTEEQRVRLLSETNEVSGELKPILSPTLEPIVDLDDDFDEPLGERQFTCDGDVCESCQ